MRTSRFLPLLLAAAVLPTTYAAPQPTKTQLAHQTLEARAAHLERVHNTQKGSAFNPAKQNQSMLNGMTILNDGQRWTAVPKSSVLSQPEKLADKFPDKPSGVYVTWSEFLRYNRSWLGNFPVTVNNIKGNSPLSTSQRKHLAKSKRVAIATFNNNPVSVLPPRAHSSDEN
ncbi:hypothetical protein [Sulfuriroseicoccus oceanibius]|uniref:Uncharacterized protein n=1 Tax=Sulfuriroseicoccus oceanibius TaxID=2707525 RepID=A0A6B3LBV3_9BACT|nr:hypothetical protein [Sulfuriroseicoccus oceanibius]QQL46134.1 hypothetical protein G3M56_006010 [Sulfuriroseicoccus oceanibius]